MTEFNAGLTPSDPWDIAAGEDGNLWFVSQSPAFIGRIAPDGTITEFSTGLTPNSQPSAITAGPDGNLWFTESADPGRIGRITAAGVITENSIGLTPNMAPTDITSGPDGNLWFTERGGAGAIGRITPEGQITEFTDGLTGGSQPTGIAAGTDGAVWFTEAASPGRIGRITTRGQITEYSEGLTADRSPWFITPGPDGNMWFTANANPGLIGRISLPPVVRTRDPGAAISDNSARLPAKVRPNAQATELYFEWGVGTSIRERTEAVSVGAGWEHVEAGIRIANLKPNRKYHYRAVATNGSGTTVGNEMSFTTHPLEPEMGELVVVNPVGPVRFKRPRGRWRPLAALGAELPVGVLLDTRRGKVDLTSAGVGGTSRPAASAVASYRCARTRRPVVAWTCTCAAATSPAAGGARRGAARAARRAPLASSVFAGSGGATAAGASAPTGATATRPCAARAGSQRIVARARSLASPTAPWSSATWRGGATCSCAPGTPTWLTSAPSKRAGATRGLRCLPPRNRSAHGVASARWGRSHSPPARSRWRPASPAHSSRSSARRSRRASTCAAPSRWTACSWSPSTTSFGRPHARNGRSSARCTVQGGRLHEAGAREIVYDVQFTEPTTPREDGALTTRSARAGGAVLATSETDGRRHTNVLGGDDNLRSIGARARRVRPPQRHERRDHALPARGRRASRASPWSPPSGHRQLAGSVRLPRRQGLDRLPRPPGTIPTVSFSDVVRGRSRRDLMRGNIVVVGATAPTLRDVHPTPVGGEELMAGRRGPGERHLDRAPGAPAALAPRGPWTCC